MTERKRMQSTRFTLSGVTLPEGADPLSLWDVAGNTGISFGGVKSAPPEPTWRIELPASPAEAQALLADKARALELAQPDLARASFELACLDPSAEIPSFGPADHLFTYKDALRETVNTFRAPEAVSYAMPKAAEDWEGYRRWQAFVEQIQQMVAHYARIETALAGAEIGVTTVGWTGDFETRWNEDVTMDIDALRTHRQAVHLALGSRIALVRVVSVVAGGAAGLALKAAIPGGQVLLLPAVWGFVRDVLAELRKSWPQLQHLID